MKWSSRLLIGIGAGIVAGALVSRMIKKKDIMSSELALNLVKKAFKEKGPIDGSWIHVHPENIEKFNLPYIVYRGGITRAVENEVEQYEFLVDASNGTILEVNLL